MMHERLKGPAQVAQLTLETIIRPMGCVLFFIDCAKYRWFRRRHTQKAALKQKTQDESMRKETPAPLPPRQRALTLPLPTPQKAIGAEQHTEDQSQSVLFGRFPLEIREMIYECALTATRIYVFRRTDRRLGSYQRCLRHCKLHEPYGVYSCSSSFKSSSGAFIAETIQSAETSSLSLLTICRRTYSEGIDLLYRKNVFCFQDALTIEYFTRTVLPNRLNLIEDIELDGIDRGLNDFVMAYASVAREAIPRMTSLRTLRIKLNTWDSRVHRLSWQGFWASITDAVVTIEQPDMDEYIFVTCLELYPSHSTPFSGNTSPCPVAAPLLVSSDE